MAIKSGVINVGIRGEERSLYINPDKINFIVDNHDGSCSVVFDCGEKIDVVGNQAKIIVEGLGWTYLDSKV